MFQVSEFFLKTKGFIRQVLTIIAFDGLCSICACLATLFLHDDKPTLSL